MMGLNLLPLIIIVIFFIIIPKLKFNFFSYRTITILVGVYILFGLISFTALKISAKEEHQGLLEDEVNLEFNEEELWSLIDQNRVNEIDKKYIIEEWSFKVPEKRFSIVMNDEVYGINVVVQYRDDPNSQEIFAKMYQIPYFIEGINIPEKAITLPKSVYDSSKNQLTIIGAPEQSLNFYKLDNSILILEENFYTTEPSVDISYSSGSTILYLNVPKHITIIDRGGIVIDPSTF